MAGLVLEKSPSGSITFSNIFDLSTLNLSFLFLALFIYFFIFWDICHSNYLL